ncbi:helix-turn-helix transcriptional regulator [Candidatus Halobonum tyrrellensis]|uniref:Transcriptional regulator n=1 Tax=Candidatus Halobonum tyrrellensis G22 TaxID=1324957 RepID=V4HG27_9EURY|nr:ArsR family transcriptional regulator [Candidatus Halobonum tyrrellensis]ESP89670.1 transcriptional regulator [Candidatus Halobonum tyrrellensis G22]
MDAALEEIEFLALSDNRVAVLELLAESPHTRRELAEETGASQPTLGRILRDFDDRHWVDHDGSAYAATATGRLVAEEFTDLRETIATERRLREVMEWLPTDEMGFDLRRLGDARITLPSRTRPGAPVGRVLDLLRSADRVRIVSHAFNEASLDAVRERVLAGSGEFEGVFSPDALDALASDDALRDRLGDLLDADRAEVRIHDGPVPLAVTVTDDVVHLLLRDADGLLRAAVDTDDEAVLAWANETHERYWRDADPLDPETLEPRPDSRG